MDSTTFTEAQKEGILKVLKNDYMSSDESLSDDSSDDIDNAGSDDSTVVPKTKVLVVKRLTWRSRELNETIKKLDRRVAKRRSPKGNSMRIERRDGPPSSRQAPEDAPGWALNN